MACHSMDGPYKQKRCSVLRVAISGHQEVIVSKMDPSVRLRGVDKVSLNFHQNQFISGNMPLELVLHARPTGRARQLMEAKPAQHFTYWLKGHRIDQNIYVGETSVGICFIETSCEYRTFNHRRCQCILCKGPRNPTLITRQEQASAKNSNEALVQFC